MTVTAPARFTRGRITPGHIRTQRFSTRRRGLDPDEVHAYLEAVAEELATLSRQLVLAMQENDRIKRALRDWQSRHGRLARIHPPAPGYRRPTAGRPTNS